MGYTVCSSRYLIGQHTHSHRVNRYREQSSTNIPLRLDWNTFTAPPPLFGQHPESNRLHNWALHGLQYRQDIHEDIRDHNIQILQKNSLQLKFEITVKLNNIAQYPHPLNPPNITAQSLPPPFITTEVIYNTTDTPKRQLVTSHFITHTQDYHTHVYSKNIDTLTNPFSSIFRSQHKCLSPHRTPGLISNTLRL